MNNHNLRDIKNAKNSKDAKDTIDMKDKTGREGIKATKKASSHRAVPFFSAIWERPLARVLTLVALLALSGFIAYNIAFSSVNRRMGLDIVCLPSTGSCSILRCGTGIIVIDAGTEDDAPLLLDYLHENNIKKIDAMIITSDDPYCCSGAVEIIGNVMVEQLIIPDMGEYPSNAWGRVEAAALKEGLVPTIVREDSAFILQNTSFLLLPVNKDGLIPSKSGRRTNTTVASSSNQDETGVISQVLTREVLTKGLLSIDGEDIENNGQVIDNDSNNVGNGNNVDNSNNVGNGNNLDNSNNVDGTDQIDLSEESEAVIPSPPCCLFVSVMYGSGTALFAGNAPDKAVVSYLSGELGGRHDVVMLPYGGKMFDSLQALLTASNPSGVIISCDSADAVEDSVSSLISATGANTYLTCDGEIRISTNGNKMKAVQ